MLLVSYTKKSAGHAYPAVQCQDILNNKAQQEIALSPYIPYA